MTYLALLIGGVLIVCAATLYTLAEGAAAAWSWWRRGE